jgi:hypothetical protein
MSSEIHKNDNAQGHGDFERRDIGAAGIIYFFVGLAVATLIIHFLLAGLYNFLDKRAKAGQPAVSPLITTVPADTRQIPYNYPERAFPDPLLERDERTQLNDIRVAEEQKLASYDWVDQKAGTMRIPIDRAMDLIEERGLPVRSQEAAAQVAQTTAKQAAGKKKGGKR